MGKSNSKKKFTQIKSNYFTSEINENKLIFFGVSKNGKIIAKKIIYLISQLSKIHLEMVGVKIDLNSVNRLMFAKDFNINNKSVIIVSDVSQSAKTLQLIISSLMSQDPFKIKTAVMVNRDHSLFPVKINFSGLNLSTSVNEHVDVSVNKDEEFTVYLN